MSNMSQWFKRKLNIPEVNLLKTVKSPLQEILNSCKPLINMAIDRAASEIVIFTETEITDKLVQDAMLKQLEKLKLPLVAEIAAKAYVATVSLNRHKVPVREAVFREADRLKKLVTGARL